jgi:hypothetical protein
MSCLPIRALKMIRAASAARVCPARHGAAKGAARKGEAMPSGVERDAHDLEGVRLES